jgi:hypothetical protein
VHRTGTTNRGSPSSSFRLGTKKTGHLWKKLATGKNQSRYVVILAFVRYLFESFFRHTFYLPSLKRVGLDRTKFQNTKSCCICYYLARLRRLNDFDCPLLLAQHWQADDTNLDASSCAKTLILQESQNGDIPVKYHCGALIFDIFHR